MEKNSFKRFDIKVFNRVYHIKTDQNQEEIEDLGKALDQEIKELSSQSKYSSEIELTVLATLRLLDKCKKAERELILLKELTKKMELGNKKHRLERDIMR